jgi:isopenicillin-N N-acyltransferase like protein
MRITTIAGAGTHRGLDYGRELAREVAEAATALKTDLAAHGHPPAVLARRLTTSPLARVASDYTPDLWAEVTALAGGGRVPLEDVLLLTFLDEVWAMTRSTGCSVIARVVSGHAGTSGGDDNDADPPARATTEIGQTMDLPAWAVGRMRVLRVGPEHAPTALVMAYPGTIGLCGSNEAGVGVAVNALLRAPATQEGLGVAFIVRHLLTMTTLEQAEAFLTSVPHASGQAYTIAAPDGLATFEADAEGVRRVTYAGIPAIIHTNHAVANDDNASTSSRERLAILETCLERHVSLADALTGEVLVDGTKWDDPHVTFGAFRATGSEASARFADGADLQAGRREWSRFTYK